MNNTKSKSTSIELHIIQNFAPSCLNRDDTNTPKDCVFGGVRRARISSQCIKRAIRLHASECYSLQGNLGVRTKRLFNELLGRLVKEGKPEEPAKAAITAALDSQKLSVKEDGKTQYILFLGEHEIDGIKETILKHWDLLSAISPVENESKKKKEKKANVPEEVGKSVQQVLQACKAADISLFGRMVADAHDINIDAACQVAHAISTHKVDMEMDFFTAVDDLQPDDNSGADMMGTVEFNSACFYRYAVINWEKLIENLHNDSELAKNTVEAFIRASIEAIPTGKQNTFAAQNPPSFVYATVRNGAPWSLTNAFEKPIHSNEEGYTSKSIQSLDEYWKKLSKVYTDNAKLKTWVCLDEESKPKNLGEDACTVDNLIKKIGEALS